MLSCWSGVHFWHKLIQIKLGRRNQRRCVEMAAIRWNWTSSSCFQVIIIPPIVFLTNIYDKNWNKKLQNISNFAGLFLNLLLYVCMVTRDGGNRTYYEIMCWDKGFDDKGFAKQSLKRRIRIFILVAPGATGASVAELEPNPLPQCCHPKCPFFYLLLFGINDKFGDKG